jgi:hypothetical protein
MSDIDDEEEEEQEQIEEENDYDDANIGRPVFFEEKEKMGKLKR